MARVASSKKFLNPKRLENCHKSQQPNEWDWFYANRRMIGAKTMKLNGKYYLIEDSEVPMEEWKYKWHAGQSPNFDAEITETMMFDPGWEEDDR
jgi:hypothetical protein